jgi:hypothetical protein
LAGGLGFAAAAVLGLTTALVDRAAHQHANSAPIGIAWAIGAGFVALALVAWLLLATTLQLVVELAPVGRRVGAVVDAITPRAIRSIGHGLATAAATVSLTLTPAQAGPSAVDAPRPSLQDQSPDRGVLLPVPAGAPATAHLEPLASTTTTTPATPAPSAGPVGSAEPIAPAPPAGGAPDPEVVVQPGDDFWRIAEAAVASAATHDPTEREVADYWMRLIEANADRLVVPGTPDLIYPGQVLRLPPVTASSRVAALPETL